MERQETGLDALSRLAGGLAHNFNNLLTIIHGNAALLLDRLGEDRVARKELESILNAADRATEITRQLLAFSRTRVRKPQRLDLSRTIREMEPVFRRMVGDRARLELRLEAHLWPVRADAADLEHVLINLLTNALDSQARAGQITITTANATVKREKPVPTGLIPPGEYVAVSVIDTGRGIPAAHLTQVFNPFFSTKQADLGVGMGLATVHGIVRQSGGHVWLESAEGKGTTARIYLPRAEAGNSAQKPPAQRRRTRPPRVLVVEDEPAVRDLVIRVLRRDGFEVLDAADGRAALDVLAREPEVDLVLCDVVMPGMSGAQLADRIRSADPSPRIVFMSGYTEDEILRQGILRSEVSLIEKPFSPDQLRAAVSSALGI